MLPDPAEDERLARGRYLVETLGHCAECHTPRNMLGSLKRGPHLAGSRYGPGGLTVPNITPDTETGIGSWSEVDLAFFLRTGFTPYGDDVQGEMREAIDDGLRPPDPGRFGGHGRLSQGAARDPQPGEHGSVATPGVLIGQRLVRVIG